MQPKIGQLFEQVGSKRLLIHQITNQVTVISDGLSGHCWLKGVKVIEKEQN